MANWERTEEETNRRHQNRSKRRKEGRTKVMKLGRKKLKRNRRYHHDEQVLSVPSGSTGTGGTFRINRYWGYLHDQ
jgi:hypothetical protein